MAERKVIGYSGGVPVDDELIEALADEAERGYDDDVIRSGRRGRPALSAAPSRTLHVKVEPELFTAVAHRASDEGVTSSAVVRRALRMYLAGSRAT